MILKYYRGVGITLVAVMLSGIILSPEVKAVVNAPLITNVKTSNITVDGAAITWTTDKLATSKVYYGFSPYFTEAAGNVIDQTLVTSHTVKLTALKPATRYYYYVVSEDENGEGALSRKTEEYRFTTVIDDPKITDVAAVNITNNAAVITWKTQKPTTSKVRYYLANPHDPKNIPTPQPVGTVSDSKFATYHSLNLTGLKASTLYYYELEVKDELGSGTIGQTYSFATKKSEEESLRITNAFLRENIIYDGKTAALFITWVTNKESNTEVEYGTTSGLGSTTVLSASSQPTTNHLVTVNNLLPDTTYYFRLKSVDYNESGCGMNATNPPCSTAVSDQTFKTIALGATSISKLTSQAPSDTKLVIKWVTDRPATTQVEYTSKTLKFIKETSARASYGVDGLISTLDTKLTTDHEVALSGLIPNATYYYRVLSKDSDEKLVMSSTSSFTMPGPAETNAPVISDVRSQVVSTAIANIYWITDEYSTSQVEYGLTTSYGSSSRLSQSLIDGHLEQLTNLTPDTTYHFRVRSLDKWNNAAVSNDYTFKTNAQEPKSVVPVDEVSQTNSLVEVPDQEDVISPSAVSDFTVVDFGNNHAILVWTAPGDDGSSGVSLSYDVRYAVSKITHENWETATKVKNVITPSAGGSKERLYVDGLESNTTYHFGIKARDEASNTSGLSNIVAVKTANQEAADTTPPGEVTNFSVLKSGEIENQAIINWAYPSDIDFMKVVIVRKADSAPSNKDDGQKVYEGIDSFFIDTELETGKTHYYKAFAVDEANNYSKGTVSSVLLDETSVVSSKELVKRPVLTSDSNNLAPPSQNQKFAFIVYLSVIIMILLGLGGGGYWYFVYRNKK